MSLFTVRVVIIRLILVAGCDILFIHNGAMHNKRQTKTFDQTRRLWLRRFAKCFWVTIVWKCGNSKALDLNDHNQNQISGDKIEKTFTCWILITHSNTTITTQTMNTNAYKSSIVRLFVDNLSHLWIHLPPKSIIKIMKLARPLLKLVL